MFGMFLFRQSISNVPGDLLEAENRWLYSLFVLEYCNAVQRPMVGAFCLMHLASWNNFL